MTNDSTPQDTPGPSGNRWEPPAGGPAPADETATASPAGGPVDAPAPASRSWKDRLRPDRVGPAARTGIAAGAAALLVGGVGGFAVGHASADGGGDGHGTVDGQRFAGHSLDGHGFDGLGPGGSGPDGDHAAPPQGQLPGGPGAGTGAAPTGPEQEGSAS